MWIRTGILLAAAATLAGAAYLEFVRDIRTPRSPAVLAGAVRAVHASQTERDIAATPSRFMEALGVLLVGADIRRMSIFPFRIGPGRPPDVEARETLLADVRDRFGSTFRAGVLGFAKDDFAVGTCRNMPASDLGLAGAARLLELSNATTCFVNWRRPPTATMLVGVAIADGGPWIRPFTRGVCTRLARAWIDQTTVTDGARMPNYVGCVLVDRPTRMVGATSNYVYEVRKDGVLALIE
jgi:hypothetical protein